MTPKEALIKKYGSEGAYREHMRSIASRGGSRKVDKGFSKNHKLASEAGKAGRELQLKRAKGHVKN